MQIACCSSIPTVYVNLHLPYGWAERYVLSTGHVLEQRIALEDKANLPLLGGYPCGILICTQWSHTLFLYSHVPWLQPEQALCSTSGHMAPQSGST